jgi:hypothetical protein
MSEKREQGRPTKYKKEYDKLIIEHMAQGFSNVSFAGTIGICKDTLYEWVKTQPSFSYSMNIGETKRLAYQEKIAQNLANGNFNGSAAMQIFIMKNLGKSVRWTDKTELDVTADVKSEVTVAPVFGTHTPI